MLNALATVTFAHVSGFAEDSVVNTFAFQMAERSESVQVADLGDALEGLYNNEDVGSNRISLFLGNGISRAANSARVRVYDVESHLDGSNFGSPVGEHTFTPGAISGGGPIPLPEEVALVVTTRATGWESAPVEAPDGADAGSEPDRPKQRRSGRIYLGPFHSGMAAAAGTYPRPHADRITFLLARFQAFAAEVQGNGDNWAVWSRKDGAMRNVTDVQIDNAWDTQRRRGTAPTVRTTVAV